MINWTTTSFLLFLQLGSFVLVNGYTLDDPEALGAIRDLNRDLGQDEAMNYLDYLEDLKHANLFSDGGIQK